MKKGYVEVSFLKAPYFAVRYGVNEHFEDFMPTNKYFKKLKERVKNGHITEFNETDDEIIYKQDNEYYYIKKENLPDRIIEELRKIKKQFNKRKYKPEMHSNWRFIVEHFHTKEDEIRKIKLKDYIKANKLLIVLTPFILFGLGLLLINNFLQMKIIDFILISTFTQASAVLIKRHFSAFYSTFKEIKKFIVNGQYYKSSINSEESKSKKNVISAKNKNLEIKQNIVDQINIIYNIINCLCIESQKLYQKELFKMLGEYKEKIKKARANDDNPLVYEYDIDIQFFQRLIDFEARININTLDDTSQYIQFDQTLEQIEEHLREQLASEDKSMVRTRENNSQIKLGI